MSVTVYRYAAFMCSVFDCGSVLGAGCNPPQFAETKIEYPEVGSGKWTLPRVTAVQRLAPGWSTRIVQAKPGDPLPRLALLCPEHQDPKDLRLTAPGVFMCAMPDCGEIMQGIEQNSAVPGVFASRMLVTNGWNVCVGVASGCDPFVALFCPTHSSGRYGGIFGRGQEVRA